MERPQKPGTKSKKRLTSASGKLGGSMIDKTKDGKISTEDPVIGALNNSKYRWRTIKGIANETTLPPSTVHDRLQSLQKAGKIVKASVPNKNGEQLFTTVSHYEKSTPITTRVKSAFSGKIL